MTKNTHYATKVEAFGSNDGLTLYINRGTDKFDGIIGVSQAGYTIAEIGVKSGSEEEAEKEIAQAYRLFIQTLETIQNKYENL